MTNHEKAKWFGRIFVLLLAGAIIAVVFAPKGTSSSNKGQAREKTTPQNPTDDGASRADITSFNNPGSLKPGQIDEILAEAAKNRGGQVIGIVHCHAPGNPESEQIADILNRVAKKYGNQVKVIRVDTTANPEYAKEEKVTHPPKVVMWAGKQRACKFQGLWTQAQIERKVDELIHGLEAVGKDWRPEVKGMTPASATPGAPSPSPMPSQTPQPKSAKP